MSDDKPDTFIYELKFRLMHDDGYVTDVTLPIMLPPLGKTETIGKLEKGAVVSHIELRLINKVLDKPKE